MRATGSAASTFEETRRRHLIEATIDAVADVGFKAASLSQIAKRADVSIGLFAHYFGDKDGLLEATLRYLAGRLVAALRARLRFVTDPRGRLLAVVDVVLGDQEFDQRTSAVWLAFWGQITHSDRFRRIQHAYQRRLYSNLCHAFEQCAAGVDPALCAKTVAATIDGLWLQSHAYGGSGFAQDARCTVQKLVDTLLQAAPPDGRVPPDPSRGRHVARPCEPNGRQAEDRRLAVGRAREGGRAWCSLSRNEQHRRLLNCADRIEQKTRVMAELCAAASGRSARAEVEFSVPRSAETLRRGAARLLMPRRIDLHLGGGWIGSELLGYGDVVVATAHRSALLVDICRSAAEAFCDEGALAIEVSDVGGPLVAALSGIFADAEIPEGSPSYFNAPHSQQGDLRVQRTWLPSGITDIVLPKSAAAILKGADVERAVVTVLSARAPFRRTADLSEILLFAEEPMAAAVERASISWCEAAPAENSSGSGSASDFHPFEAAIRDSVARGAELIYDRKARAILRIPAGTPVPSSTNMFAPVLSLIVVKDARELRERLHQQDPFASFEVYADDPSTAMRVAQWAASPFCSINDYQGHGEREDAPRRAWLDLRAGRRPTKWILARHQSGEVCNG